MAPTQAREQRGYFDFEYRTMAEDFPPDAPGPSRRRGETSRRRPRKGRRTLPAQGEGQRNTGDAVEGTGASLPQTNRPAQAGANAGAQSAQPSRRAARNRRGGKRRNAASKAAGKASVQASAVAPKEEPEAAPRLAKAAQHNSSQSYAAIDLGTNNCRLLIARPSGDSFVVVDAFSRVVRLGEGLAQTGRLSDAAMDRALGALRICADKLRRRGVTLARSVATEACRRASNGPEFIERVARETGIRLDIISAREEARLAVLGCHILLEPGHGPALVFDIGGGSTELVLIEHDDPMAATPTILDFVSIPYGVVSLTESCEGEVDDAAARARRYGEMRCKVAEGFAAFAERIAPLRAGLEEQEGPLRLLGTSGTVTTLASVHLDLPHYDRSAVDGCIVPAHRMRGICEMLSTQSIAERREVACIGRERADLVVAGCAILESILDLWPALRLGVADRGIREGILRSLIGIVAPATDGGDKI
jgi:exopolyphosphatase/guanosine-5'-triphosphate,3'-diphosphate pyrophosphatase